MGRGASAQLHQVNVQGDILNANVCFHDIGVAILVDDVALHGH